MLPSLTRRIPPGAGLWLLLPLLIFLVPSLSSSIVSQSGLNLTVTSLDTSDCVHHPDRAPSSQRQTSIAHAATNCRQATADGHGFLRQIRSKSTVKARKPVAPSRPPTAHASPANGKPKRKRSTRKHKPKHRRRGRSPASASGGLDCYPGPYTSCKSPLPGSTLLPRAPAGAVYFNTNPVLLPPGQYSTFIINANESYFLSGSYSFDSLLINGYLTCGGPTQGATDINIVTAYISVAGIFHCGKPGNPYTGRVNITMTGDKQDGQKHIMVTGWLMMVGIPRKAWTQIGNTIQPGSNSFSTVAPVDWKPGERLVITTTSYNLDHNEDMVVASVTPFGGGSMVTVTGSFKYPHWGQLQTYATPANVPRVLDERAEVALLERNIMVQGDQASEANGQGAFLTVVASGNAWFRDVMFHRVGQRAKLGRYPVHWHITGDRKGNYISNSVIVKSWNRCISIHATNYVKVTNTVCYDHIGHGFMIEDGCEIGNVFRKNLGIRTRRPSSNAEAIFDTDMTHLSTFWITNSLNHYIGNRGVASEFTAYWFMPPARPIQLCRTDSVFNTLDVARLSLGRFEDNVGHSGVVALGIGLNICDDPRAPDCKSEEYSPYDVPEVKRFLAYKNKHPNRAFWIQLDKEIQFSSCVMADNGGSMLMTGRQIIRNALFVGQSGNTLTDTTVEKKTGLGLYAGNVGLINSHFAGFEKEGFRCISPVMTSGKKMGAFVQAFSTDPAIPRKNRFQVISNTSNFWTFNQALLDVDGSLTGQPGTTLVGAPAGFNSTVLRGRQDADFNVPAGAGCVYEPLWGMWLCRGVTWGNIIVTNTPGDSNPAQPAHVVDIFRSDGKQITISNDIGFTYQFLVILGRGLSYRVAFRDGNSLAFDNGKPRRFVIGFQNVDVGASIQLTVEGLPRGAWQWSVYDCRTRKEVARPTGGTAKVSLTADGKQSGSLPNQKYAYDSRIFCTGSLSSCCR